MHLPSVEDILYSAPAFILAISCHEFAHAWVADRFGDPTARQMGRLTLNPRSHFDLFGFLLLIFAGLGWAKGVPYNSTYFRGNKRVAMIAVSLAGVMANLILAVVSITLFSIFFRQISDDSIVLRVLSTIFSYNVLFFVLNLIPIPPLDGSKIVAALLLGDFEEKITSLNPNFGFFILLGLVYMGWLQRVVDTLSEKMCDGLFHFIFPIFQGGF